MTEFERTITEIAKKKLGIETLEERKSDELDFYDLAVWNIREALEAAYRAGADHAVAYRAAADAAK